MTDGLDQALVDAGLNLLRADSGLVVFDGVVPNPRPEPPYVLVYTTVAWPGDDPDTQGLNGLTMAAQVRWICHCVGDTQKASRAVAQRVRTALMDQRPTVANVNCRFIRYEQEDPPDPSRNELIGSAVIDTVYVYRMTADK